VEKSFCKGGGVVKTITVEIKHATVLMNRANIAFKEFRKLLMQGFLGAEFMDAMFKMNTELGTEFVSPWLEADLDESGYPVAVRIWCDYESDFVNTNDARFRGERWLAKFREKHSEYLSDLERNQQWPQSDDVA
jgi:hypothetical protein